MRTLTSLDQRFKFEEGLAQTAMTRLDSLDSTRRRLTDPAAERPGAVAACPTIVHVPSLHALYVIVRRETLLVVAESRSRLHACVMQR